MAQIRVENLRKSFDQFTAVQDSNFTIENGEKNPERIIDVDAPFGGDSAMVTKNGSKETLARIAVDLLPGKTVTLEDGKTWLRLSNMKAAPKKGEAFPLTIHFRSAPNVTVMVPVGKGSWL